MKQEHDMQIICEQCQIALTKAKVKLSYMNMLFDAELLRCPKCGQIFIPEDLAQGKIHDVEIALEEK